MKKLRKKNKKKKKINLDYEELYDLEDFFMNQEDIEKLPHDTFTTFNIPKTIEENKQYISSLISESDIILELLDARDIYHSKNSQLEELINNNDPLICPCKCNGSMKFVHLTCLKNNINLKIHKKHDKYYDMYLFQNYNCEICLATFPKYLIIKNKKINLLEIELSNYKNYALCDLIQYDENNDYIYHIGYLVLRLENEIPIKIGRKKENNVIFNDLSISGYHCELLVQNNILYLKDLGSKYGSMKYIRNKHDIQLGNIIELISGKYKFEFNLIKKESISSSDLQSLILFFVSL